MRDLASRLESLIVSLMIFIKSVKDLISHFNRDKEDQKILVATNNGEIEYLGNNFSLKVWKVFKRRNAVAKLYRMNNFTARGLSEKS